MRRTPTRRLFAAALLVGAVLAPMAATPSAATAAATVVHLADGEPYGQDDTPPDGLGRELTARLDKAVEGVRQEAGIPGVIVGLWMPGKGTMSARPGSPTPPPVGR